MSKLLPDTVEAALPARLIDELYSTDSPRLRAADISELRLRLDRPASITASGENIPLSFKCRADELNLCLNRLCKGSIYAHGETLKDGYIRVGNGIRAGIGGIFTEQGSLSEITSLNLRIPHIIRGVSDSLLRRCIQSDRIVPTLIYSPPGIGKTTLLRDLASRLGGSLRRRVTVIDTRGELYLADMFSDTLCDFISGATRARAIELATRVLSPEVLICDELGDLDETRAILSAQNTGAPLIASAHASSLHELLLRPNIRLLHDSRVFSQYVGLSRERVSGRLSRCFSFHFDEYERVREAVSEVV